MFIARTALKDIRRRLRDPVSFAIWLGIPLVFGSLVSLAFSGLGGNAAPAAGIWVADEDESLLSGIFVTALGAGGDLGLPIAASQVDPAAGRALIEKGKGSALLIIPRDFGDDVLNERPTRLTLVTNPAQSVLPQIAEESVRLLVDAVFYLQQGFSEPTSRIVAAADASDALPDVAILINEALMRLSPFLFPPVIELEVVGPRLLPGMDIEDQASGFIDLFLPPMLFMALVFMAIGISEDIWVEKQQGTLQRVLATPHASAKFLAGKLLAATAMMSVVAFVSIACARYLFGAQVQNLVQAGVWTTFSGTLLLVLVYVLQLFATSQRSGGVLSSLIMIPLLMLGGSFFPFDVMPDGLARIGRFTPNGWALTELVGILRDDVVWGRLAVSAAVMLLVGIVAFLVANRRMAGAFARN